MKPFVSQSDQYLGDKDITLSMLEDDDVFYTLEEREMKSSGQEWLVKINQTVPVTESLNTPTLLDVKRLSSELDFKEELSPVHNCAGKSKCSLVSPLLQTPTLVDGLFSMLTKTVFQFPEVANGSDNIGQIQGGEESRCVSSKSESMDILNGNLYKMPIEEKFQDISRENLELQGMIISRSTEDLSLCCHNLTPVNVEFPPISLIREFPLTPKTPTNGSEMLEFINWQRRPQEEDASSYSSLAESTNSLSLSLCSLYSQDEDLQEDLKNNNTERTTNLKSVSGLSLSLCNLHSPDEDLNNNVQLKGKLRKVHSDYDSATSLESLDSNHGDHKLKRRFQNVCTAVNSKRRKIQKRLRRLTVDLSRCEIKETSNESVQPQDAEKDIAYRNKMERERRSKMNDKFDALRESIPDMEKMNKASKVLVLNRAKAYIKELEQEDDILSSQLFIEKEKNKKLLQRLVNLTQQMN